MKSQNNGKIDPKASEKKVAQFFASLADETRLKILLSLTDGAKNVNQIYDFVGRDNMTLSAISHQLRQLSDLEVIHFKKNGKEKLFHLSGEFCWCIIRDAFNHFNKGVPEHCAACTKTGGSK
jgi:DNA-binding transcriptional ArsR family regulator